MRLLSGREYANERSGSESPRPLREPVYVPAMLSAHACPPSLDEEGGR